MNPVVWLVLAVVVVAVALAAVWLSSRRRRSDELRDAFGPEYDRAVQEHGERGDAERDLAARAERVEQLHIRSLSEDESAHFAEAWRGVQAHFVDDPEVAIAQADELVAEVMQSRGYPMGNFEQRAADVSVDHPRVVENYRAAHAIASRSATGDDTPTEDLRQAMVHYRALFDELIGTPATPSPSRR